MSRFDLKNYGLIVEDVRRNLAPARLYAEALQADTDAALTDAGALIAYSGKKTGRSPKDKRVVGTPRVEHDVWWGPVNIKLDQHTFTINRERAIDYLNTRDAAVLRRRLRRLGSELPAQGPRDLRAAVPRAVHAQHADPADAGGARRASASPTT